MTFHSAKTGAFGHCGFDGVDAAAAPVWILVFLTSRVAPAENDRDFRAHSSHQVDAGRAPM